MCAHVCVYMWAMVCLWRSKYNLVESFLSFHLYMSFWYQIQATELV